MSASQRSHYTKRRKQIWEALHPEPKGQRVADLPDGELEVEQVVPPQVFSHGGARPQEQGFAAATAAVTGESKQSINRRIARADALVSAGRLDSRNRLTSALTS